MQSAPKLCGLIITGHMEHQPLHHIAKTWPFKPEAVNARRSLSNSRDHNSKNKSTTRKI